MPPIQRSEYSPIVVGFVEGDGYVNIPLQVALERYGQLPSEYGLVPHVATRRARKSLNLPLGLAIIRHLRNGASLKETIARFYDRWGRDFQAEFRVTIDRLFSRNDPSELKRVLETNSGTLAECLRLNVREYLHHRGLVALPTLRSIPAEQLLEKAEVILAKKRRNPAHRDAGAALDEALSLIRVKRLLEELAGLTGGNIAAFGKARLAIHGDEIARVLWQASRWRALSGVDRLNCVRGSDVEFELAPRDVSFLTLGKEAGDCTADKWFRQVDRDVENIYWTVFSWFLDRQYQIMKVYHDGQFIMKVHLLPLLLFNERGQSMFLAVDAIETTPAFREDTWAGDTGLLDKKEAIFRRVVDEVVRIAEAMGIKNVYAERFSNTAWVRRELERFPEVYLHIGDLQKIDELEDVFELAKRICADEGEAPSGVFMELQMKNTYLLPGGATMKGVKSFAVLAGDTRVGLPMKRVIGI
jgi:hypothetical protein